MKDKSNTFKWRRKLVCHRQFRCNTASTHCWQWPRLRLEVEKAAAAAEAPSPLSPQKPPIGENGMLLPPLLIVVVATTGTALSQGCWQHLLRIRDSLQARDSLWTLEANKWAVVNEKEGINIFCFYTESNAFNEDCKLRSMRKDHSKRIFFVELNGKEMALLTINDYFIFISLKSQFTTFT